MSIEDIFFVNLKKVLKESYAEYMVPWEMVEYYIDRYKDMSEEDMKKDQYYEDYKDCKRYIKSRTKLSFEEFANRKIKAKIEQLFKI